jgi:hypothetical protein
MVSLFLPFTPNGKATELRAIEVKKLLDLGPIVAIDPVAVLPRIPARLVEPRMLWEGCPETAKAMFADHADDWSGLGLGESPYDGAELILLNPSHAATRRRATLMEEIVHIVLKHPKSALTRESGGAPWKRVYAAAVEDEAFSVGAACLMPYPEIFHAIRDAHENAASIAGRYGVSESCVEFRIKRAGLSRVYGKHCGAVRT